MTSFRRRRDVRFRIIDREAVVLRQDAGETLVLNEVGARMLQLFDSGVDLPDVARSIAAEFEVESSEAERDTRHFAGQLIEAGILEADRP